MALADDLTPELQSIYEHTPYWGDVQDTPMEDAPRAQSNTHDNEEGAEDAYFTTLPSVEEYNPYAEDDWWVARPEAYDRFYELIHHLRSLEDTERTLDEGGYLPDDANVRHLRQMQELKPRLEAEAQEMAEALAQVSENVLKEWLDGHLNHYHRIEGGLDAELADLYDVEQRRDAVDVAIEDAIQRIAKYAPELSMGDFAREMGLSNTPPRWDHPDHQDKLSRQDAAKEIHNALVGPHLDAEEWPEEAYQWLLQLNNRITNSVPYKQARYRELMEDHPAFPVVLDAIRRFRDAENWEDLIIPIDIAKSIAHTRDTDAQRPNLFGDYYGFQQPASRYKQLFDAISSGEKEPVWDTRLRMASLAEHLDCDGHPDLADGMDRIAQFESSDEDDSPSIQFTLPLQGVRNDPRSATLTCPECGSPMVLRNGEYGLFYGCTMFPKCKTTIGAHPDGTPLGRPGTTKERAARQKAHEVFDKLWQGEDALMNRDDAYHWLANVMDMTRQRAHIANFGVNQCEELIHKVSSFLKEYNDRKENS